MAENGGDSAIGLRERIGLFTGAALFFLMLLLPAPGTLEPAAWHTAAVAALMAVWWMTEAIPIPATALLPLVLFPVLGVLEMDAAAAPYANEIIFLFMGGFLIALAMERWELHRRIALAVVAFVGTSARRLVFGFMAASWFISMWISNTATTAMMLPIALAIGEMFIRERERRDQVAPAKQVAGVAANPGAEPRGDASAAVRGPAGGRERLEEPIRLGSYNFGVALMLGIAYASTIGGIATLIGTPPNAVFAGAAREMLGEEIGFLEWMAVGLPLSVVLLPITWALLVFVLHPPGSLGAGAAQLIAAERAKLGSMSRAEKIVAIVFALTAIAWIMREPKTFGTFTVPGIASLLPGVADSTIAMAAATVLFMIPVDWRRAEFVMDWKTARRLPWGVLILFGGGLSLARAMDRSGLAAWIGTAVSGLAAVPPVVIIAAVVALSVFLSEMTSNTAQATMSMPIMAGAAAGLGLDPLVLMSVAVLATSTAFMLPVGTPPNAIVFGSGYLTIPQMARAGFLLNLISIILVTLIGVFLVPVLH